MTAPEAPGWMKPGTGLSMPAAQAPHEQWMRYAIDRGMSPGHAAAASRDQLALTFDPRGVLRHDAPRLERHERDADTRTVADEARCRPGERE